MRDSKTEQVGRRRMQILQREHKRKAFCVNNNNNNTDINAANKKGLKKFSYTC